MDSRIKRAKMVDQFMTIVFYGIALFFFLLLVLQEKLLLVDY